MGKKLLAGGFILAIAAGSACGRSDLFEEGARQAAMIAPPENVEGSAIVKVSSYRPPRETPSIFQADTERRLIRTAELEIAVDDTRDTATSIAELVSATAGYVGSSDARQRRGVLIYSMTLRVPAVELDPVIERIKALAARVDREQLAADDVTDQIVDLDARLRMLTATEVELLALLSEPRQRDHGLEDVMAVYRELTDIRTEIERLRAQLDGLERRVALSTINLVVRPSEAAQPVADPWSPADRARASVRSLVAVLQGLAGFTIFFFVVVLPVTLLLGVPAWGTTQLWQAARNRRMRSSPTAE